MTCIGLHQPDEEGNPSLIIEQTSWGHVYVVWASQTPVWYRIGNDGYRPITGPTPTLEVPADPEGALYLRRQADGLLQNVFNAGVTPPRLHSDWGMGGNPATVYP